MRQGREWAGACAFWHLAPGLMLERGMVSVRYQTMIHL